MKGDLLDTFAGAVEGKLCGVNLCSAHPVAERNGRALCAKHRDHYDHSTMGTPCPKCDSRQWVESPKAESVAVCALCDYVTYDKSVIADSWRVKR